jgi:hypothetical protein
MSARDEAAAFILAEATALGIRIGPDGDDLVMLVPGRIPCASRWTFEIALENYRAEVIEIVMREGTA